MSTPLDLFRDRIPGSISVVSPVFEEGGWIPRRYTCDGDDVSPEIRISGVPGDASMLALIMYDPDAPIGVFYHWLLYNIPVSATVIPEGLGAPREETGLGAQGVNDFGRLGYGGPCPPRRHGPHRYYFLVLALRGEEKLPPRLTPRRLLEAVRDRAVAYGYTYGRYERR